MIIQIDLMTLVIGIFAPPLIVFLCGLVLILIRRINTYYVSVYTRKAFNERNNAIEEAQRLKIKIRDCKNEQELDELRLQNPV